jgi:flavin-dependent dehydrogenase
VLLVDAVLPGAHKVGEALPGAALRLLRAQGLPLPGVDGPHTPIRGTLSAWGSEALAGTDFLRDRDGPGWRLDRSCFDESLRDAAVAAGAVSCETRVTAAARDGALWNVRLGDDEAVSAGWLIDATGRRAVLARRLGARRLRDTRLIALYGIGRPGMAPPLHRTVVEAVPCGWWYAAYLPSGAPVAGLHVGPRDAARLVAQREGWRAALRATRHVAALLPVDSLDLNLPPMDAGGARLDGFAGDGWVACGDAALAFDPVSGQGMFAALYGGMMAARAVAAALGGDSGAMVGYVERMERVRRAYRVQWVQAYRSEQRWPDAPFWAERAGSEAFGV